jgi:hypothetical protein
MGLFGKKKTVAAEPEAAATIILGDADATASAADTPDDEIAAVIAAAIAAYEAEQYKQTLYIRKLNRTAGARPAWGVAGMTEAIDTRRM